MNGPYIKDLNNSKKIFRNILISLIPLLIYKLFLTGINGLILLLVSSITTLTTNILIEYIKNTNKNYIYSVIIGIIIFLVMPSNTPFMLIFLTNIISIIIFKFVNFINPIAISSFITYIFFIVTKNEFILPEYNIYILIGISIITLIYLIVNKAIKFRISLAFLLINLLGFIMNLELNGLYLIIVFGLFVIPELFSTPNLAMSQILCGLILGILSILLPIEYFILSIIIINFLNKYIDLNIAIYLAN